MTIDRNYGMVEIVTGWIELALVQIALNLLVGCLSSVMVFRFAAPVSGSDFGL